MQSPFPQEGCWDGWLLPRKQLQNLEGASGLSLLLFSAAFGYGFGRSAKLEFSPWPVNSKHPFRPPSTAPFSCRFGEMNSSHEEVHAPWPSQALLFLPRLKTRGIVSAGWEKTRRHGARMQCGDWGQGDKLTAQAWVICLSFCKKETTRFIPVQGLAGQSVQGNTKNILGPLVLSSCCFLRQRCVSCRHPCPQSGTSPRWFAPPGPSQAKLHHYTALEQDFPSFPLGRGSCCLSLYLNQYFHIPVYSGN